MKPISTKEDLDDTLALCLTDIKVCCGTLFPNIFYSEFSGLHQAIFDLINAGHKKIAIAAPRGIGKTSIARAVAMRSILFRMQNFIVYLSNSATSAEMQTENIKRDLMTNENVKQLFGNIKEAIGTGGVDESFSKSAWTAFGTTFVLPRGAGQQVRGLNWANNRPQLVIIDDLEDKDEIQNEDNRKKLKSWFWSDLMKTEDRYSEGCIFIYIDTIKHEDSLLVDLMESDQWATVQLSICDANYKSLDPNYMTDEEIADEVAEHRRLGTLDAFYMERMNIPISKEDQVFKSSSFHYFEDQGSVLVIEKSEKDTDVTQKPEEVRTRNLVHVTILDPAKTVKLQSADSAIITLGIDRKTRRIFDRDTVNGKFYPDEIYDEAFRQIRVYNSLIFGYEVTGLSAFISQPIEQECRIRGLHPQLVELNASGKKKAERVATLAPLYRLGYMYHNKNNCGVLETQLLGFPRSKLWDVMDAKSYITFIMDKFALYFDPSDNDEEEPDEAEFEDLDCEDRIDLGRPGLFI
jgi:hypothetical protein